MNPDDVGVRAPWGQVTLSRLRECAPEAEQQEAWFSAACYWRDAAVLSDDPAEVREMLARSNRCARLAWERVGDGYRSRTHVCGMDPISGGTVSIPLEAVAP
jgi:hypothetical protein